MAEVFSVIRAFVSRSYWNYLPQVLENYLCHLMFNIDGLVLIKSFCFFLYNNSINEQFEFHKKIKK